MDEDPEGYAITTSHLPDTTDVAATCSPCSSPWIWIILFVLFLLLSIGFLIWALYLLRRDKNCNGCTGPGTPISFDNAKITVDSSSQISGSWTTTDPGDVVKLFATLHPPIFTADGGLSNNSAATNFNTAGSAVGATGITGNTGVTGTANSVSLGNLTPGLKYYATLIARNPKTNNYKSYTQIVYMEDGNITTFTNGPTGTIFNTFELQDILQVGAVQVASDTVDSNGVYTVEFNQRPRQARDLFYFNNKSQLQLVNSVNGPTDICLFNNGGNLVAFGCTGTIPGAAAGSNSHDSYWTYNPRVQTENKLCLKNTVDTATPICLILTGVGQGTGTLSLGTSLPGSDGWVTAFENGQ
jgi:hypothetical protein